MKVLCIGLRYLPSRDWTVKSCVSGHRNSVPYSDTLLSENLPIFENLEKTTVSSFMKVQNHGKHPSICILGA